MYTVFPTQNNIPEFEAVYVFWLILSYSQNHLKVSSRDQLQRIEQRNLKVAIPNSGPWMLLHYRNNLYLLDSKIVEKKSWENTRIKWVRAQTFHWPCKEMSVSIVRWVTKNMWEPEQLENEKN